MIYFNFLNFILHVCHIEKDFKRLIRHCQTLLIDAKLLFPYLQTHIAGLQDYISQWFSHFISHNISMFLSTANPQLQACPNEQQTRILTYEHKRDISACTHAEIFRDGGRTRLETRVPCGTNG